MKVHKLKIKSEFWQQVIAGNKTFEFRVNDRDYQPFDYVIFDVVMDDKVIELKEYDLFQITYVLKQEQFEMIPIGWCIFSIKRVQD